MVSPASPSASSVSRVASRSSSGSPGAASWKVNSAVPSARRCCSTRVMRAPASSGPRIISSTQRIFCPTTTVEIPSPAVVRTTWVGQAVPSSTATRCTGPSPGSGTATRPGRGARGRVHHDGRRRWRVDLGREVPERVTRQRLADVARLLVADAYRLDDFVVAARARRVVRAVEHELAPTDPQQRSGIVAHGRGTARSAVRPGVRGSALRARPPGARRPDSTRRPSARWRARPERSSPHQVRRPSTGWSRTYSPSDVIEKR